MGGERPGSAAAARLFKTGSLAEWQAHLDAYSEAVAAVGVHRKKKTELMKWNSFLIQDLPVKARERGSLSLADMEVVMNWKITKHTFRPLMGLLKQNSAALVEEATAEALKFVFEKRGKGPVSEKCARNALGALTKLRGVGPATGSAMLAHVDASFPFMSDEALEACSLGRKYDVPTYLSLMKLLGGKAETLGPSWSPEEVGRALWTAAMVQVHALKVQCSSRDERDPPKMHERDAGNTHPSPPPSPLHPCPQPACSSPGKTGVGMSRQVSRYAEARACSPSNFLLPRGSCCLRPHSQLPRSHPA